MSEETVFIGHYAEKIQDEIDGLLKLLPVIEEVQWDPSPAVQTDRDPEMKDRIITGALVDPTASITCDPQRLAVRAQAIRSERIMKDALVRVRGVRRGLEIALDNWEHGKS